MEAVNFSEDLRKHFSITSCTLTKDDHDFIAMLIALSDDTISISTTCEELESGIQIKITFPTIYGKCEIEAEVMEIKDSYIKVFDCKITSKNKNDFFIEFQNYLNNLIIQKKRKEERILCNKKNIELLRLNQTFFLTYKYRNFKAVITDISYSGIRIRANPLLLQVVNEVFNFTLQFREPEEKFFFVRCPVVRKNQIVFEDKALAEIVFKLPENIKFRKRLDSYYNEIKKGRSR